MDSGSSKKRSASASPERSPTKNFTKKFKSGITAIQKQALIDNLQLEITERARRLRAQYNIQAQQLRSRLEMRVFRVPYKLRKMTMGELLEKAKQPQLPPVPPKSSYVPARPPPVPAKDLPEPLPEPMSKPAPKPIARKPLPVSSSVAVAGHKRLSDDIAGADKENHDASIDNPYKRNRVVPALSKAQASATQVLAPASYNTRVIPREVPERNRVVPALTKAPASPTQVLSPTSSNTRVIPRDRPASPMKSMISRPMSPVKTTAATLATTASAAKGSTNLLSTIVGKAKATRTAASTRKATTSSNASSNGGTAPTTTTATGRVRKAAAPPPSTATRRGRRKVSDTSETSEKSTGTVIRKTATASKAAAPKKTATKKAAAPPPTTGRTLRKRG
ncbi:Borealin N terminal-domain-containing protein [Xylariaceae sp. FL1272]|nr:Borealin N terminal-domain-containing protein [Xylariaceae sp. FL1272]